MAQIRPVPFFAGNRAEKGVFFSANVWIHPTARLGVDYAPTPH